MFISISASHKNKGLEQPGLYALSGSAAAEGPSLQPGADRRLTGASPPGPSACGRPCPSSAPGPPPREPLTPRLRSLTALTGGARARPDSTEPSPQAAAPYPAWCLDFAPPWPALPAALGPGGADGPRLHRSRPAQAGSGGRRAATALPCRHRISAEAALRRGCLRGTQDVPPPRSLREERRLPCGSSCCRMFCSFKDK